MMFLTVFFFILFSFRMPCFPASPYHSSSEIDACFFDENQIELWRENQSYGQLMACLFNNKNNQTAQSFIKKYADQGNVIALYARVCSKIERSSFITPVTQKSKEAVGALLLVCLLRIALDTLLFYGSFMHYLPHQVNPTRPCYFYFKQSFASIFSRFDGSNFRNALDKARQWFTDRQEMLFESPLWVGYCYEYEKTWYGQLVGLCWNDRRNDHNALVFDPINPVINKINGLDAQVARALRPKILEHLFNRFQRIFDWHTFFTWSDDLGFHDFEKLCQELEPQSSCCSLM